MEIKVFDISEDYKAGESDCYHYSSENNIPMVLVNNRATLGDVSWDCITVSSGDEFIWSQEDWIKQELKELVQFYVTDKTKGSIGAYTGKVKGLPRECTADFARDVCNTLSQAYKQHKHES